MLKYFLLLLGYVLTISGSTYIIGYLNLLQIGYNFEEYVNFIIERFECWMFVIGIIILFGTIIISGKGD